MAEITQFVITAVVIKKIANQNRIGSLGMWSANIFQVKVVTNEDTMLRTHCCGHKCVPVCPSVCPRHKNVSDFFQKHFVSATNVFLFAQPAKKQS